MFPFFMVLNYLGLLRASSADEVEGLDSKYHNKTNKLNHDHAQAMSKYGQANRKLRQSIDDTFEENKGTKNAGEQNRSSTRHRHHLGGDASVSGNSVLVGNW